MKKKSLILLVLLLILAVGIGAIGISRAAYIFSSGNKQVIVTGETPVRFSADYLQRGESSSVLVVKTVRDGSITLNVYNYPYGSPSEYNQQDISFDVRFEVTKPGAAGNYSVNINGTSNPFGVGTSLLITGNTLLKNQASKLPFYINIPDRAELLVTVTPKNAELPTLSRTLRKVEVGSASGDASISWSPIEWFPSGPDISKFAGFNYQISGSGAGTCSLSWNSDLVSLDDYFLQQLEHDFGSGCYTKSNGSIVFPVDSAKRELYSIRFLRIPGKEIPSFDTLGISMTYTAQAPVSGS